MPTDICYLCGKMLGEEEVNGDHIFQQQFIKRQQPKSVGFDYAGVLFVHKNCNNKFGSAGNGAESICKKALHLLEVLYSENAQYKEKKDDPNIRIVAINSSSLPEFTDSDIAFFKFNDGTNIPYEELMSRNYFTNKSMINPFQVPINVALSTLAKSVAGFLVKRYNFPKDGRWRILAIPHYAENEDFSFDDIFGCTQPLEIGITLWIKYDNNQWIAAYKFNRLLIFLFFESIASAFFNQVASQFIGADCLFFESSQLIDLIGYEWHNNKSF